MDLLRLLLLGLPATVDTSRSLPLETDGACNSVLASKRIWLREQQPTRTGQPLV